MEQEFVIDKQFPFVKITTDKEAGLYVFKCNNCHGKLELAFGYAKRNDMKEEGLKFLFEHKNCKKHEEKTDLFTEMKKDRKGKYKNE